MHSSFVIFCYPLVSHIISQTSAYVKSICSVKIVLKLYFVDAKLLRYVKQIFKIITYILGIWEFAEPYPQYQNLKSFSKDVFILHIYGNGGNAMENELLKKLSMNLCADKHNYMKSFRKNVDMYISEKDITLREVAEMANMPFDTLKNFLYKDNADCKLSTAVKLARALNVSIDELIGAETINEVSRESISICRNLPDNALYLIRWYIRYIDGLNKKNEPNRRYVSVMELECGINGNLQITTRYRHIDISDIDAECGKKIFFGITIPCDYYMPIYSPYDILLVANDRPPMKNENSLIRIGGCLYVAKRRNENKKIKYYSIRDNKFRFFEKDIDEEIGYIAKIIPV